MPWRAGLLVFLVHLGVQGFFLAQVRAAARAPAHAVGGPRGGDGPFELVWRREPRRWRWAALTLLGMTLACAPWTWRSYESLGGLFFVRCNFGLEHGEP